MRIETGEVEDIKEDKVRIRLEESSFCRECRLCYGKGKEKILEIPDSGNLRIGDRVKLSIPEWKMAVFSLLSFGLPLLFLLAGGILGYHFFKRESIQALVTLGMFFLGLLLALGISRSKEKKTMDKIKVLEVVRE